MPSIAPAIACPHCSSDKTNVATRTLLKIVYLCLDCGRTFTVHQP